MSVDYLQDLVQNIYTNCDMSGFDDYNKGIQSLSRNMENFNADTIRNQKRRISLVEAETKSQIRLADYQEQYAQRKKRRDEEEISRMHRKNGLQRYFTRLFLAVFSFQAFKSLIETTTRIDLLQKSLYGLTKSTQDWEYVQEQAFATGTKFETVARGYRNFFSSARMAGFDKQGIQDMYTGVLLSSRAIGASAQQTEGALLALEQMLSKGTVSMEELRRQLGNAIPGAFEIGAKAMDMTTKEFNKFVKTGQLASAVFVPKFVKALVNEYGGGMDEIRKSTSFALTNLQNAWVQLQVGFMSGETGKEFAKAINLLTDLLRSQEFKDFVNILATIFRYMVEIVSFAIKHIKTIIVLLGAGGIMRILPQVISALKLLGLSLGFITSTGVINGIKILTASFWSMLTPFMALYAKILLVISALLILQDIYTAIRHPEKNSLTRRVYNMEGAKFGGSQTGGNPFEKPQNLKDFNDLTDKLRSHPAEMYQAPSAGFLKGIFFNKNETKNVNVSLGDININSNNGNPMEIAQAVQEQLVSLFTAQGLTMGVQEVMV